MPSGVKYCPICKNESEKRKYRDRHPPPIKAYDPKTQTKICGRCGVRKSIAEFRKRNDRKANRVDLWTGYCAACGSQKYHEWYEENKERKAAYGKSFYERNIDTIRQYDASRWLNGKKERTREIVAANRDRYNSYGQVHRAKKLAVGGVYTDEDVGRIRKAQRGRCAVCREKLTRYHVDHITPLAAGGTNEARNIQLLCPSCNVRKFKTDPIVFMQRRGFLL